MTTKTSTDRALNLLQSMGIARTRDLERAGISRTQIRRLVGRGLIFRLGESAHAERFALKGAMLFKLWADDRRRATWDLDLLGRGANTVADVVAVIQGVCAIRAEDGIDFDAASLVGEEIRDGAGKS